jgi:hypothetical protein
MPQRKSKFSKQRPVAELQVIAEWLMGDTELAETALADLYFLDTRDLAELWKEVRAKVLSRWRKSPARFREQHREMSCHLSYHGIERLEELPEAAAI